MAGELLMSISQDEKERAVFRSRRMYQTDMDSNLATVEERGEKRGELVKALAVARNMIKDNESIDKIMRYTGLAREEVENMRC